MDVNDLERRVGDPPTLRLRQVQKPVAIDMGRQVVGQRVERFLDRPVVAGIARRGAQAGEERPAEGVFGEPAGVTATAGVKAAVASGIIKPHESVTVVSTGSGLKDVKNAMLAAGEPFQCEPDIKALEASGRIR